MEVPTSSQSPYAEPVTISDVLNLASWDRQRSDDELRSFISRRESITANIAE